MWEEVRRGFHENDLLTRASAMSFQVAVATVPLLLTIVASLAFFGASDVWTRELAPQVRGGVSPPVFQVLDDTVTQVLTQKRATWLSLGLVLTLWYVSSAIRAVMGGLEAVYGVEESRGLRGRLRASLTLAPPLVLLFLGALAVVRFGAVLVDEVGDGLVVQVVGFVVRWGLATALLLLAVGLLVHFAPAVHQPVRWVGVGAVLAVGAWLGGSGLFTVYLVEVADYASLFGNLASVVAFFSYLYLSSCALLLGVQCDAILRRKATGSAAGNEGDDERAQADTASDSAYSRASA